ncbi:MAG TPA: ABC transporter ATP-binding protein [Streptosporangiaceae bacterium]|nr:ABC transporter ATP-binding protein [Streptosporangiaceae bacterium]
MDAIRCEGLTKRFGAAIAVDDLTLAVAPGQVYGFLGPNGAGKTTTIRMLLGLIAPGAGRAWLLGRPLPDPRAVARVGSMIEEPAFYPWLSGRANLEVQAATAGRRPDRAEVARVLSLTGLEEVAGRKVRAYSQGMRQRLGLAAALLGKPPLLIADEPTNGLDPAGIRELRDLLGGLAADGTTVFLSSHLLAEVEQVCDRVAVISRGRLVEEGPTGQLGVTRRRVRVRVEQPDVEAAAVQLGRWPGRRDGQVFVVDHGRGRDVNAALAAAGVIAESVTVEQPSLEDRFLELVTENPAGARTAGPDAAGAGAAAAGLTEEDSHGLAADR